ncbi:MAG: HEPN domain-containing protein [Rickettsia endosymbiont of Sergentomyia squamirostris]|uniref:HEPN domain-containing protein n=1 Tax=Candidatus Tisiphia endosymbiont of Sergentomyia squamirostris TaxID=3113639 RepID=A0AAT9G6C6_9RICK
MKTTLPERSLVIKERLDTIVQEILASGKSKIAMIVLFGSYARGDWVQDVYTENHITYVYQSDIDLLLVLKKGKYAGYQAINLKYNIYKRLDRKFPIDITKDPLVSMKEPSVTLILEPIHFVNNQLAKGKYFFRDIRNEGILLYDTGEFVLSEAKDLPWSERKPIAQEEYECWFGRGKGLFIGIKAFFEDDNYSESAFLLHQATESFYNAILLVFDGYKPKLHDLLELNQIARIFYHDLCKIFPYESEEQKACFDLLRDAYVKARYDKHYRITKEQLLYLIGRVEQLQKITEKICLEKLSQE